MFEKKTQRGFGLAGMSMVAAFVMSGALFAQEAEGVPDVVIGYDEQMLGSGDEVVVGDDLIFLDENCIDCTVDEGDGSEDPSIDDVTGGAPEVVRHLTSGSAASRGVALQRGPDLCAAPAQEVVWLCTLFNGKPKTE